jgi:acetyl-CoA C-acetyltransferase
MASDVRTPVLVGAAAVVERVEDPREAAEPLDLMEQALRGAEVDAGTTSLLRDMDSIWAPRGFWAYSDPGRILAERLGTGPVRTAVAEVGILQSTILGRAARSIAEGEAEVVAIVGAEARDRANRFTRQGEEVPLTEQAESTPDELLMPHQEIMGQFEIDLGLITPVIQYAMIDNALRFHEGQSMEAHRAELGSLWGRFNEVAVGNEQAWNRRAMTPEEIVTASERNRMLAYPYTKSLVSQWNVNQGGAVILCSLEKARALGLDEDRFVYPLAVVDSEHMVTLSERRDLWRSPGFALAGERAFEHVGRGPSEIEYFECYSCFPAAVRTQQRELGIDLDRTVTQTGGMTFGGGPLNNFVVQSWVKMVERMRADHGSHGVVTAVSGLLTKQGLAVFGPEPSHGFLHDRVTKQTEAAWVKKPVDREATGRGTIATYTVSHDRNAAHGVAMIVELDDGRRTLRVVDDPDWMELGEAEELCGRGVELGAEGEVRWT